MSLSELVDSGYRIHPSDLHGNEIVRRVSNVSYQGLEDMSPVLHLDGIDKRLVLDSELSLQMIALTHTSLPQEWIGAKIRLTPVRSADRATIRILPAGEASVSEANWRAYLLLLLLILAMLASMGFLHHVVRQLTT